MPRDRHSSGIASFLAWLCLTGSPPAAAQSIFTVAGGGTDDGRPATIAPLLRPIATAIDSEGTLYIADEDRHRVRRIDSRSGIITTVAGTGIAGYNCDDTPASQAQLDGPIAVAVDGVGNLLIADRGNHRIRRVDVRSGRIETVAGTDTLGFSGDGGPATLARLSSPAGLALDRQGNIYVVDASNERIRIVEASSGRIRTVAGNGVWGDSGDGGPATQASFRLSSDFDAAIDTTVTRGLAIDDSSGVVYVSDTYNHRVRRVDLASGIVTNFAGTGIGDFSGDGGPASSAELDHPAGLAISAGGLYVADSFNDRVRRIDLSSGIIATVAGGGPAGHLGDGGPATGADVPGPSGVTLSPASLVVSSVFDGRVRSVDRQTDSIRTIGGNGSQFLFDEGGPALAAGFLQPSGLARNQSGDLFIADTGTHRIRRVDASTGTVRTLAGTGASQSRFPEGEDTPATETTIGYPMGIAVDASGDVYFAAISENRVRKISMSTGTVRTIAGIGEAGFSGDGGPATMARLNLESDRPDTIVATQPPGLAFDLAGNLYIADRFNARVRRVDPSGIITTIAGNGTAGYSGDGDPATMASLALPTGIAVDGDGNLIILDTLNYRVRVVEASTMRIRTVAGNGESGTSGEGGPAIFARLAVPHGVAVDRNGDIYVADALGQRLLRISARDGTLTRLAGSPYNAGFSGDYGPASTALLSTPTAVVVDDDLDLYIVEKGSARVRAIRACSEVSAVVQRSPANGSSGITGTARLEWDTTESAFRYDVYVDTVSPPSRIFADDVVAPSLSLANLEPLKTYYWKIVAKGDPFCPSRSSSVSELWSFTTASDCRPPVAGSGASRDGSR